MAMELFNLDWYHIAGYTIVGILLLCCCGLSIRFWLPKDPSEKVKKLFHLNYFNPALRPKEKIVFSFINPLKKLKRRDRRNARLFRFEKEREIRKQEQRKEVKQTISEQWHHRSIFLGFSWRTASIAKVSQPAQSFAVNDDIDIDLVMSWADRRRVFRREKISSRRSQRMERYLFSHSGRIYSDEETKHDIDIEKGLQCAQECSSSEDDEEVNAMHWWNFDRGRKRNEVVESRREHRRKKREEAIACGEIDHVAMNSGPSDSSIPPGYHIVMRIPGFLASQDESDATSKRVLYWWKDTNWFVGAIIGVCKGEDSMYRIKFERAERDNGMVFNGVRKVRLSEHGEDGYFRRWILLEANN